MRHVVTGVALAAAMVAGGCVAAADGAPARSAGSGSGSTVTSVVSSVRATVTVPAWMTRECAAEDDVDCHWYGGTVRPRAGEAYIRQVPGTATVCVMFVRRPARDYCARR